MPDRKIDIGSVARALNVVGDRWTQLLIQEAFRGASGFEFRGHVPLTDLPDVRRLDLHASLRDPFGNTIQQPLTLTFTTRPFEPSAMLQMPYQPIYRVDGPQDFYLTYVNLNSYNVSLYRLTFDQFVQASRPGKGQAFQPPDTSRIWQVNQQKPAGKPGGNFKK